MSKHLLLEEMTRTEARAAAEAGAMVVWPLGAIEQHGPHLPVGTDTFTIEHLARHSAVQAAASIPIVVAPTMPFGSSHHHLPFGGTMSLGSESYYRLTFELLESLIVSGFQRLFLLNGHGGNHELLQLVARDLALKHSVSVASASYWTVAWDAMVALDAHVGQRFPGHAGAFETSVILSLRPELVCEPRPHRDRVESTDPRGYIRPYRAEFTGSWQKIDGYTDSPDNGTAELGRSYLLATIETVAKAMIEFHRQTLA